MRLRNEFKAGLFIAISLALVGFLILVMGRERQIFASQVEFYSTFKDAKGLAVGAPVRLGGIPIGRVAAVGFGKDLNDFGVHVTLLINEDFLDRVRADCSVSIETQGLLGDRFIAISPGSKSEILPPMSNLVSLEVADIGQMLGRAQAAVENTTQISDRINKSLEGLTPDTFAHLGEAAKSLSDIFASVQNQNGFVHRLIYSEKDGAKLVDSISRTVVDISSMIAEVKGGKGVLNSLIYKPDGKETVASVTAAAGNIAKASSELASLLEAAKDGKGILHDIIYTEVQQGSVAKRMEEVLVSLNETAKNLRVASEALSKGTGTLGALLVDPQLYDNLVEVTDGAKRSFILRQAIRSSLKQ